MHFSFVCLGFKSMSLEFKNYTFKSEGYLRGRDEALQLDRWASTDLIKFAQEMKNLSSDARIRHNATAENLRITSGKERMNGPLGLLGPCAVSTENKPSSDLPTTWNLDWFQNVRDQTRPLSFLSSLYRSVYKTVRRQSILYFLNTLQAILKHQKILIECNVISLGELFKHQSQAPLIEHFFSSLCEMPGASKLVAYAVYMLYASGAINFDECTGNKDGLQHMLQSAFRLISEFLSRMRSSSVENNMSGHEKFQAMHTVRVYFVLCFLMDKQDPQFSHALNALSWGYPTADGVLDAQGEDSANGTQKKVFVGNISTILNGDVIKTHAFVGESKYARYESRLYELLRDFTFEHTHNENCDALLWTQVLNYAQAYASKVQGKAGAQAQGIALATKYKGAAAVMAVMAVLLCENNQKINQEHLNLATIFGVIAQLADDLEDRIQDQKEQTLTLPRVFFDNKRRLDFYVRQVINTIHFFRERHLEYCPHIAENRYKSVLDMCEAMTVVAMAADSKNYTGELATGY